MNWLQIRLFGPYFSSFLTNSYGYYSQKSQNLFSNGLIFASTLIVRQAARGELMMKKLVLVLLGCLIATGALAETKGFQMSLIPNVAIYSKTTYIKGVSLNVWGENPQNAFALGLVNGSTGNSSGFSLGLIVNYADSYKGLQIAPVNYASRLHGLQLGFVNMAMTAEAGVQIGVINIMSQTEKWFSNFPDEVAPGMVFVNWRF
jgi:hypothetical protein